MLEQAAAVQRGLQPGQVGRRQHRVHAHLQLVPAPHTQTSSTLVSKNNACYWLVYDSRKLQILVGMRGMEKETLQPWSYCRQLPTGQEMGICSLDTYLMRVIIS